MIPIRYARERGDKLCAIAERLADGATFDGATFSTSAAPKRIDLVELPRVPGLHAATVDASTWADGVYAFYFAEADGAGFRILPDARPQRVTVYRGQPVVLAPSAAPVPIAINGTLVWGPPPAASATA